MFESELERTISGMKMTALVDSEDYAKQLSIAERLHEMVDKEESPTVSKEVLITVAANLLGIIMIIKHEHVGNFVSSKALGFVIRAR